MTKGLILTDNSIFWDVDPSSLNPGIHQNYIIPRVMDYGTLEDVKRVMRYYGEELVLKTLKNAPYLDKKTVSFFGQYYRVPLNEFRAYRKRESFHTWK